MLVTNQTKRLDIPGEEGMFAVILKLSWRQLRDASDAQGKRSIEGMRAMGGELIKAFRESTSAADAAARAKQIEDAQAALASNYDRDLVLSAGLVSWAYDIPPSAEGAIGMLDEATAKFLHEAIVGYAREDGGSAKNGSDSSIAS